MKLWDTRQTNPIFKEKQKDHIQDLAVNKNLCSAISSKKDELIFLEISSKSFCRVKTVKMKTSVKKSMWKDNFLFVTDQRGNIIIFSVN